MSDLDALPHSVEWQFQRGDTTLVVDIRYEIEPYDPGRISGPPEDCYPPEGGCVTDLVALNPRTSELVELTAEEREEVAEWIERNHDHAADRYGDPDAAYDAWSDDQMDRGGNDERWDE